ncbi:MAG: hypothetical protein PHN89_03910 [Candidatus Pacebacteria bacterium]|nr:hypothetical protein [Candidatus Paceibacterota bacterium]
MSNIKTYDVRVQFSVDEKPAIKKAAHRDEKPIKIFCRDAVLRAVQEILALTTEKGDENV